MWRKANFLTIYARQGKRHQTIPRYRIMWTTPPTQVTQAVVASGYISVTVGNHRNGKAGYHSHKNEWLSNDLSALHTQRTWKTLKEAASALSMGVLTAQTRVHNKWLYWQATHTHTHRGMLGLKGCFPPEFHPLNPWTTINLSTLPNSQYYLPTAIMYFHLLEMSK